MSNLNFQIFNCGKNSIAAATRLKSPKMSTKYAPYLSVWTDTFLVDFSRFAWDNAGLENTVLPAASKSDDSKVAS